MCLSQKLLAIKALVLLIILSYSAFLPAVSQSTGNKPPSSNTIPFPIANRFSVKVQRYTGINWLSELLASNLASLIVKLKVGGKVRVAVKIYSFTDLLAGKIKSVKVSLSNSYYHGVPLGNVTFASTNPIWYRYFKSHKTQIGLQTPLLVQVNGSMTENLISKLLQDSRTPLKTAKLDLPGLGQQKVEFLEPQVNFREGKVHIVSTLVTPGGAPGTGINVTITGTPYLSGNNVLVKDLVVSSTDIVDSAEFSKFVQDLVNPLVNLSRLDRRDHAFRLGNLSIDNNCMVFDGNLLVAPQTISISSR
jgi:hypothetical protein